MTCLQRNLKDVRYTCLKQWIMDALITHTSMYAHTHSYRHVPPHIHTATDTLCDVLHSLLSVDQHYIIWLNQIEWTVV